MSDPVKVETASLLLLLAGGLGLWLLAMAAGHSADRPAAATVYQYHWVESLPVPEGYGIHRRPVADTSAAKESANLAWGQNGPAWLALFTFQPLDVNRAEAQTLTFLPGIGPTLAGRIVEHRHHYGPFREPEELLRVYGIGPKTMAGILPLITLDYH